MAELDLGKLSLKIEADGRAAISELARVKAAAESSSADAARAYNDAGEDMADAFEPVADAAEKTGEELEDAGKKAEKTGQQVKDAGEKAGKSLKETLDTAEKFGSTMTRNVTAPLLALYGVMVDSASDLTETIGKTEVTFAGFSGKVLEWSEGAVESMGLAQGTALDMASTFGDMAVGMGVSAESAADMSMNMTQLAADLASFKNISAERAAQALAGVYTGETEALKSLGIVMTQANLQAFALTQGITKQVSEMSQAEQVALRYEYVMANTANAQGDFARTGGNLANQGRALGQTLKQLGASFGEVLTPAVTAAVSGLRDAAKSLIEMDESTKTWILSIGLVVAAIGPLIIAGTKLVKLITALKAAMTAASFGPWGVAIAAAAAAVVALYTALRKTNEEIDTTSTEYRNFVRTLNGEPVHVEWEVKEGEESDQVAWDAFYDKVESLGWEAKSFTATGVFTVDPATTEQANAYAEALANAATATSEYDAAVESLNNLLEQQLQAQMAQINQQVSEESRKLVAMYNEGLITDAEFDAGIERIVSGAKEAKAALEEQAEAAKQANEAFNNGNLSDDAGAYGESIKQVYANETLSAEDWQGAIAALTEAKEAGADMTQYVNEAKVALNGLKDQAGADYEAMVAAQEEYTSAVEKANKSLADAQSEQKQAEAVQGMVDAYVMAAKFAPDTATAFENVNTALQEQAESMGLTAEDVAAIQEEFKNLLTTPEGMMNGEEAFAQYGDGQLFAAYQEQLQQAITDAETAKATAAETFAATLNELTGNFTAAETQMVIEMVAATGASISEADAALIASVESMIDEMALAAASGNTEVTGEVADMIAGVNDEKTSAQSAGKDVGSAITAGIESGLSNGTGALYATARSIVNRAIKEMKIAARIASPSKRARNEVGLPIIQGVTGGIDDGTPEAVRTIRRSVERVISGGTQVVNKGGYTVAAIESAGAFGFDYDLMGEKMTDAVSAMRMAFYVGETELAKATRESNARQAAARQHEINMGRGRAY